MLNYKSAIILTLCMNKFIIISFISNYLRILCRIEWYIYIVTFDYTPKTIDNK